MKTIKLGNIMTQQIEDLRIIAKTNIEEKDWVVFYRFSMHRGKRTQSSVDCL